MAVCKFFGINAELISAALEEYEPKTTDLSLNVQKKNDLIIDAYNANPPTSMKASLDFFTSIPSILPKMVILGEMKELGEVCYDEHRKMMEFLKDQPYDKIYLVGGELFKYQPDNTYRLFENVEELIDTLKNESVEGYYILLKGSHSVHLEKAIGFL